ncbi:MAG: hypothetical protein HC905_17610 [Bacteroidales bacterium]|nr:hypothetical protein [Bacteroidales bacterium]
MIKKILTIIFLVVLITFYLVTELTRKKAINWEQNFNGVSKDPYGCYILRKTLETSDSLLFIRSSWKTLYESLPSLKSGKTKTLLIITDKFDADSLDLSTAYTFVGEGNNIFISSYSFGKRFCDSLNFKTESVSIASFKSNTDSFNLTNPYLQLTNKATYQGISPNTFDEIDTANHTVLGANYQKKANYIRIPYGSGAFYLHTQPLVFTNNHILNSNSEYPFRAISYFKNTAFIWDNYYKPRNSLIYNESRTPFRYLLSQDALRAALYLSLLIIFIYFLIGSKRKQRFIPVFQQPENSTVKFVTTIARLYQGQPDYKKMAVKKFIYLKEMVHSRYSIKLDENDAQTAIHLSEKTGFPLEKIKELFSIYRRIEASISIDDITLRTFAKLADQIYELENITIVKN